MFIQILEISILSCVKAYGHPFAMPGGAIPADPSGGFNKYPGDYPPHLFGPASPLPFPYTTSSPLPFFHLPQGKKKTYTIDPAHATSFFVFFPCLRFWIGERFFVLLLLLMMLTVFFLIIYKGYASMGAPANAASGPSSATDLNRAFLQSAVVQNMQIQQQLMAQNQALQQLLQAVRSIHEIHSISNYFTHFLALSIFVCLLPFGTQQVAPTTILVPPTSSHSLITPISPTPPAVHALNSVQQQEDPVDYDDTDSSSCSIGEVKITSFSNLFSFFSREIFLEENTF